jgi:RimJ/RimL family protein N-acetyltransferase
MDFSFRDATIEDSSLIWQWRNDVLTRKMSRSIDEISFEEHEKWLYATFANKDRDLWFVKQEDLNIGVVRFDKRDLTTAEISINLNPEHRSKGYGSLIIAQASDAYLKKSPHLLTKILAYVRRDNPASIKSFLKAGYQDKGASDPLWMELIYI